MTASPIGLRRLYHQRITHPTFKEAAAVVAWLGAMQGQDYAGTKWAFGLRLPGSTEADIDNAITDRRIFRVWLLRGTLHYVAAADAHWLLDLFGPRMINGNARRYQELELDEPTLVRSTDLIATALRDGAHLTRPELLDMLESNGISTAGQRGVYLLQRASLEKILVQGDVRRNVTTFFALPAGSTRPREDALAELARRYFTSHGPVTFADFVAWSGLLTSDARSGLESVKSELMEETIDGQVYWHAPEKPESSPRSLYLLPGFDEFVLGYRDRGSILDKQFADRICPGGNGMFNPTIVRDGRIVGTWKRTLNKKETVEIKIEPFDSLTWQELNGISEVASAYGKFLGRKAVLDHPSPQG